MYFPHFVNDFNLKLGRITIILCIILSTCLLSLYLCVYLSVYLLSPNTNRKLAVIGPSMPQSLVIFKSLWCQKTKLLLTHCTLLLTNHSSCVSLATHHDELYERHESCDTWVVWETCVVWHISRTTRESCHTPTRWGEMRSDHNHDCNGKEDSQNKKGPYNFCDLSYLPFVCVYCVCACAVHPCVCVCEREKERVRTRDSERGKEGGGREAGRGGGSGLVCVSMSKRERKGERVCRGGVKRWERKRKSVNKREMVVRGKVRGNVRGRVGRWKEGRVEVPHMQTSDGTHVNGSWQRCECVNVRSTSYVSHDSFICVTWLIYICVTRLIHMCAMSQIRRSDFSHIYTGPAKDRQESLQAHMWMNHGTQVN